MSETDRPEDRPTWSPPTWDQPGAPPSPPPPPPPGGSWDQPPAPPPPPPGGSWDQPPPPPYQQGPQPGWGPAPQPAYGYGYAPQETESSAVVALVLAIASFVVCPILPAIGALFVANNAEQSIRSSGGRKTGEGMAKAARIISWIHLGLVAAGVVLFVILILVAAVGSS